MGADQWKLDPEMAPGHPVARDRGCRCPVFDNHHGEGMPYPDGPRWWISGNCPLHASRDDGRENGGA